MRGSLIYLILQVSVLGIIPAGAGLTGAEAWPSGEARDHPRGCGAHDFEADDADEAAGSSPQVRGSHGVSEQWLRDGGIIPAGAGLTI